MSDGSLTTTTSSVNLANRRAASLGEGESSVSATTLVDVPRTGDNEGNSWSAVH